MKKAKYVRELSQTEKEELEQGLKSRSAFKVRRSQIILSSASRKKPSEIAQQLHCSDQTVRNVIRAYEEEGAGCLEEKSHVRQDQSPEIDEAGQERLKGLIKDSPREYGHPSSIWSRQRLAQTLHQEGITKKVVSERTLGRALKAAGINWRRTKRWIHSPDKHYGRRKKDEIGSKPSVPNGRIGS